VEHRKERDTVNEDRIPTMSKQQRGLVLAAMCLALATVVSAVASLNVALPDLARDLRTTQTQLQWIVDAYAVVFAGLLLLAGALGDRLGRRSVLLAGLAIFSVAAASGLLAEDPGALIAARAAMGLGAAAIMPSTLSIITNVFPPAERDRAVSIWAGVAGASALMGLVVSGALLEAFSWHSIFGFTAALGLLALAAAARVAPNSKLDRARLDVTGGALSALGLSGLVYGIIEGPDRGWTDAVTLAAFGSAVALLAAFVAWELRREAPLLDPRLFRLRGFGAGTASITIQFFAFFGFVFVILQYIQFVLGYSPLVAGLALAPMAVAMMGLSPRVPGLVERFGPARVAPVGLALMAGGFAVFSTADVDSGYPLLLAGLLLLGSGSALAITPATTAIVSSLRQSKQGVASAVNDAARGRRRARDRGPRQRPHRPLPGGGLGCALPRARPARRSRPARPAGRPRPRRAPRPAGHGPRRACPGGVRGRARAGDGDRRRGGRLRRRLRPLEGAEGAGDAIGAGAGGWPSRSRTHAAELRSSDDAHRRE
jgi:EmrB/QacA subfamily drug resistance transporter